MMKRETRLCRRSEKSFNPGEEQAASLCPGQKSKRPSFESVSLRFYSRGKGFQPTTNRPRIGFADFFFFFFFFFADADYTASGSSSRQRQPLSIVTGSTAHFQPCARTANSQPPVMRGVKPLLEDAVQPCARTGASGGGLSFRTNISRFNRCDLLKRKSMPITAFNSFTDGLDANRRSREHFVTDIDVEDDRRWVPYADGVWFQPCSLTAHPADSASF